MTKVFKVGHKISGTICLAQMRPNRDVWSQCTAPFFVKAKLLEPTIKH